MVSALGASLGKSWLAEYAQIQRKPNAKDAYERHRRYLGLSKWHLVDVITFLPILLHISFLLFACGLVVILFGDNKAIGAIILGLTAVAFIFYLGTALAPLASSDCPFKTPLTGFLVSVKYRLLGRKEARSEGISEASTAEMLLWLHDLCYGSADIDHIIPAIAGLDRETQLVFRNPRFEKTLLSRLFNEDFNPQFLKGYLHLMKEIGLWGISLQSH